MLNYLVRYYNGRGNRESFFATEEEAKAFADNYDDKQATVWRKVS